MKIKCNLQFLMRRLFFPPWQENTVFLIGRRGTQSVTIIEIVATNNITQRDPAHAYAIGADAWQEAKCLASDQGLAVVGHAHSHVLGPTGPSPLDLNYIHKGEIGAVFHPRAGTITWYKRGRELGRDVVRLPLWMRLLAFVFCQVID